MNEVGILFVEIEQDVLERGKFEEIVRFRDGFRRPAAIGAGLSRLHVNVRVVVNAVLAAVVTGIDVAVFAAEFEQPLDRARVAHFRGADEFVALNAKFIPECFPFGGHFGYEFGFRDAGFLGGALDVDAVFVGAGGQDDLVAQHALVAAYGVAHDRGVRMADVREAVRVVDRRRQIVFWFCWWHFLSFGTLPRVLPATLA